MPNSTPTIGHVLLVDERPADLQDVATLLARHGHRVTSTCGTAQALESIAGQAPDLLLLDVMGSDSANFELLREVRERYPARRMPAVFLTASYDRGLLMRAFEGGAVDYVTRPFMPEELLARVQAHIGLKLARDRLERVARNRQELVNLVAHDLKNPLASIVFASDILLNDGVRPERVPHYLRVVMDSAQDALGYIRRYLETQASQRERDSARPVAELDTVLRWLSARYSLQMETRGSQLRIDGDRADARVAIDELVLRQVTENLLSNAMKYAPGSNVDLTVRNGAPGYWQIAVEDRGPGIPEGRQRELFRPFMRLTDADPTGGLSSGLGLSLAREILAVAGGSLWYEDREGGGARFVIEVPATSADGTPVATAV